MKLARIGLSLLFVIALAAFAQTPQPASTRGIAVQNMDRSVRPGDNFFEYTNGGWIKRTTIPADRASVGVFSELADRANNQTVKLIEEAAKQNAPAGSNTRKIADLYHSYMDEAAIEKKGLEPLKPHLQAIAAIKDKRELARALGQSLRADVDPLNNTNYHTANIFGLWTAPGFEDPEHYNAYLLQGGLTLPDREYYLANSTHMQDLRKKFQAHVAAMMKLAGFDQPEARAARIVELEHAIAEKHIPLAENENIHKANNTWMQADFTAKAPGLDWPEFFAGANLTKQQKFIVWQPTAFAGESALVASVPLDSWKDWLAFHVVEQYGGVLPKAIVDERFAFFGKGDVGRDRAASAMAARSGGRRCVAGRCGRPDIREALLLASSESRGAGDGQQYHRGVPEAH